MPNKRTYGYTETEQTPKRKKISNYSQKQEDPTWLKLLFLPLKIVWWILKAFFIIIKFLWKKISSFRKNSNPETKQKMIWGGIGLVVFFFIFTTISIAWMSRNLPNPDKLTDRKVSQSTKIYDRTGEHLLYEIFTDKRRTIIEYEEIPQQLIDAVIATEDTKFYEHNGIRPLSILRAIVFGIFTSKRISGTSTLTQQLVKNAILTNERSVTRKIKEVILSLRLEQKYSKEQILKIYFNEIPYGSTNYGVEAAAQNYYGKSVKDLGLSELATLAGLPKAPTTYLNDKQVLRVRRDFVLKRMFDEGYISEDQKTQTQALDITLEQRFDNIKAPHFVLYVKEKLVEMFGENMVNTEGLRVVTTLDYEKQEAAEKAISEVGAKKLEAAGANNASLVSLDPKNGNILAMVGSADFFNDDINGQFNVATQGLRQPGSSFKPIIYAAAFEKGYTPDTVLYDVVTDFSVYGDSYKPLNYNLKELGPVSMRQALQGSLNIPAVKTLYLVGAEKGVDFAKRLGYTTLGEGSFGLSLVLGGGEVKLLEHVSAYGVFANDGIRHEPVSILQVEENNGNILFAHKEKRGERVLDKNITAIMSNVLSDDTARAFAFGAGGVLTLPGRPVSAKTGTTNAYVDAWTVGYTPDLVAGVWAGNTNNKEMKRGFGGSSVAAPIWKAFMLEALKNSPIKEFPSAPKNDAKKPVLLGSEGGNITLPINKISGRRATSSTPEHLIVQRSYIQPHNILHYVNKDDPRGSNPSNPEEDPQYNIWEEAIKTWIEKQKTENPGTEISFEEPPIEEDDEYSLELLPTLEVVYPKTNSTIISRQIDTDIRVSAPRGVTKVSYKIDDGWVGVIHKHPFNLNYYAKGLEPGEHTLFILVEDDIGNRIEEMIPFVLKAEKEKPTVLWAPTDSIIFQNQFPKIFLLDPIKIEEISSIIIYVEHNGNKEILTNITNITNLFNNQIMFKWVDTPELGDWSLTAQIKASDGTMQTSPALQITIK